MPRAVVSSIVGNPRERCSIRGHQLGRASARPSIAWIRESDNELPSGLFAWARRRREGARAAAGARQSRAPGASGVT